MDISSSGSANAQIAAFQRVAQQSAGEANSATTAQLQSAQNEPVKSTQAAQQPVNPASTQVSISDEGRARLAAETQVSEAVGAGATASAPEPVELQSSEGQGAKPR